MPQRLDRMERELQGISRQASPADFRRAAEIERRFNGDASASDKDRRDMQDFDDEWAEEEMRCDSPPKSDHSASC